MDIEEKIVKLLNSTLEEDRIIGASILNKEDCIEGFKQKYLNNTDKIPPHTTWGMVTARCEIIPAFYIEGKHGFYYFGEDMFAIDTKEDREFWAKFITRESWI